MSFYNPNIQETFDNDSRNFVVLKDMTFGFFEIVYSISIDYKVKELLDIQHKEMLNYAKFKNNYQHYNLQLVDHSFPELLGDIASEVFFGNINSFQDYILNKKPFQSIFEEYEVLYLSDKIQDFIELLVYSDIASKHKSKGDRDFSKIFQQKNIIDEPRYYTLFDRLKLYDYLKKEIKLAIDMNKSTINGTKVTLCLKIFV